MSIELIALIIMVCVLLAMALGVHVAFALMGVGLIFGLILLGRPGLYMMFTATWSIMSSGAMMSVPLFVIMAMILEFSGIGTALFAAAYKWFGSLRGGLAVAAVIMCTLLAAITGLGATGIVVVGSLALPEMYKRGYDKYLILGCIPAAGTLGPIIPPSVFMIIVAMMAQVSIGRAFMGGVFPGLLISALFCVYIIIRSYIQPGYAPGVPPAERVTWKEKISLLRNLAPTIILIVAVLGTIYLGVATPNEAAAIGAAGAFLIAGMYRQLTWQRVKKALTSGLQLSIMVLWIAIGGTLFSGVLTSTGASQVINDWIIGMSLGTNALLAIMLVVGLIMGCFMDGITIIMLTIPIFVPIIVNAGIDPVYFVVLYTITIVIGLITPPFGVNLFYFKAIAPEEKMTDIYRAAIPFCIIMIIALFLCLAFPEIIMFLPTKTIG